MTMDHAPAVDKLLQDALTHQDITVTMSVLATENIDPNKKDVNHDLQTPLMRSCHIGASRKQLEKIVRNLLDRKPEINSQDASGKTALSHASIAERCSVIKLLIGYPECDPNLQDFDGNSPLMFACKTGSAKVVKCFVTACMQRKQHLQFHQANHRGITCLMEADKRNVKDIIKKILPGLEEDRGSPIRTNRPLTNIVAVTSPHLGSRQTTCSSTASGSAPSSREASSIGSGGHKTNSRLSTNSGELSSNTNALANEDGARHSLRRGSSVEGVMGSSDDDVSDGADDTAKLEYFRSRYKNSRRSSVSLPDLRNLPGFLVSQQSVPDIVVTPTSSINDIHAIGDGNTTTRNLPLRPHRAKSPVTQRRPPPPEISCSLPNLALPPRLLSRQFNISALQEDDVTRLSLPDIPQSVYFGKSRFNAFDAI